MDSSNVNILEEPYSVKQPSSEVSFMLQHVQKKLQTPQPTILKLLRNIFWQLNHGKNGIHMFFVDAALWTRQLWAIKQM